MFVTLGCFAHTPHGWNQRKMPLRKAMVRKPAIHRVTEWKLNEMRGASIHLLGFDGRDPCGLWKVFVWKGMSKLHEGKTWRKKLETTSAGIGPGGVSRIDVSTNLAILFPPNGMEHKFCFPKMFGIRKHLLFPLPLPTDMHCTVITMSALNPNKLGARAKKGAVSPPENRKMPGNTSRLGGMPSLLSMEENLPNECFVPRRPVWCLFTPAHKGTRDQFYLKKRSFFCISRRICDKITVIVDSLHMSNLQSEQQL